jgi:hypothetical protein
VRTKFVLTALSAAVVLAACGSKANSPADLADQTTKAVYNVDVDGAEANMDDDLKTQVTRASIGDLSDKMHALGAFKGITQTSADAEKGRYTFARPISNAGFSPSTCGSTRQEKSRLTAFLRQAADVTAKFVRR